MDKKPKITKEMIEALRADMPAEAIVPHETKPYLSTIKAYYIVIRLNEVFGVGRWEVVTELVSLTDKYALVKGEFISHDYDVKCTSQYGGHAIIPKSSDTADACKSAVTDCTSKIASYLGVGHSVFCGKHENSKATTKKTIYTNKKTYNPKIHTKVKMGYVENFKDKVAKFESKGGGYDSQVKVWFIPKTLKKAVEPLPVPFTKKEDWKDYLPL